MSSTGCFTADFLSTSVTLKLRGCDACTHPQLILPLQAISCLSTVVTVPPWRYLLSICKYYIFIYLYIYTRSCAATH